MFIDDLSEEQLEAVNSEGNLLLTACPGSGKTRVITCKIAKALLQSSQRKVLALTFTVRAAEEMVKRLGMMNIDTKRVWAGTLHSFCLEWIITPYASQLEELRNGFKIADEEYSANLIRELKEKYGIHSAESLNLKFNREGKPVERNKKYEKILWDYHQCLNEDGLIDFDLLLFYSYKILLQSKNIALNLANIFQLICIDEYQDTQDLQYAIISLLVKAKPDSLSVFFVGDVDQAIYKSMGGVAKTYLEIKADLGNLPLKALSLADNYRSSQRIVNYYRNFQQENIKIRALGKYAQHKGLISFNTEVHSSEIVSELVRLIRISLSQGIPADEICILVPQWWLVISVSRDLMKHLPSCGFITSSPKGLAEHKANLFSKLLRLLFSDSSNSLLKKRLEEDFYKSLNYVMENDFCNFLSFERHDALVKHLSEEEYEKLFKKESLYSCLWKLLSKSISARLGDEAENKIWSELEDFSNSLKTFIGYRQFKNFSEFKLFYEYLVGSVLVNTCMGVKGEEFETVIAYGLLHGYLPHWAAIINGDEREASQRLLYVLCSRAKLNLHLIAERGRKTNSGKELELNKELAGLVFEYDVV